jgi:GxxExxY protein
MNTEFTEIHRISLSKFINKQKIQLINYLKATGIEVGLLLNFGSKADIKRKIYTKNKNLFQ